MLLPATFCSFFPPKCSPCPPPLPLWGLSTNQWLACSFYCQLVGLLKKPFFFCSVVDYHSWPTACLPAVSLWFDLIRLPVWILLLFSCILDRPSVSVWPLNVPVGRLYCNKVWVGSWKPTVLWEVVHGGLNIWRFWSFSWMINHPRLKKKRNLRVSGNMGHLRSLDNLHQLTG